MPRPKRAKVASTVARVAKSSKPAEPPATQQQPKSRKPTVSKQANSFSDDSDGIVVKSTRARKHIQRSESQEDADFTMTGALPVASEEEEGPKNTSKIKTPLSNASRKSTRPRGSAHGSSSRKSPSVVIPANSVSRCKETTHATTDEGNSSGFGDHLLSFTSLGSESPAHGTRPPSAIKVGATPAHERSILALTNFKRRVRQPSLLRMVHQTTDVEDNDLDDLDDLDDFHPNAESTPLPKQQSAPGKEASNDSGVNLSSSSSRGTKRKLSPVIQVPRSSPPYDPPSGPDMEESRSSSPSLPDVVRSTVEEEEESQDKIQERAELEIFSDTMAPPMSSSDYGVDEIEDAQDSPDASKRRGRRAASAKADEEESENEKTVRPRQLKGKQKSKSNQGISTAKLQALLPRRRTRPAYEDSDSASPLDSDQDELSMPSRRHAQLTRKIVAPKASKKSTRATKKSTVAANAPTKSRTYGRRISSDKENEGRAEVDEDSEESGDTVRGGKDKPSAHLEAMAKKFQDVDAFDLDFESVSYVQTSSSPWR